MNVGDRIKYLREKANLSNRELANLSGLSQPVMNRIENNQRNADVETIEKICLALGISLKEFFNDEDDIGILTPELRNLLDNAKELNTEQLDSLNSFLNSIKVVKKILPSGKKLEYAQAPGGRELTEEEELAISEYLNSIRNDKK